MNRRARYGLVVASVTVAALLVAGIVARRSGGTGEGAAPSPATVASTSTSRPTTTIVPTTTLPPTTALSTTTGMSSPSLPPTGRVLTRGRTDRKVVALTFDAGSDLGHTNQILDTLAASRIHATFGVTGQFADRYPSAVRRIAEDGHQVVNHSYDHPSFTGRSTEGVPLGTADRRAQLQRAEAAITTATGSRGTQGWFRPPYGDIDQGVVDDVAAAGWPTVLMWTVDSLGWKGVGADAVVQRCMAGAAPGAIFLLHVGQASDDAAALPQLIAALRAAGYGFDTAAGIAG